jgi:hypothetical protein
MTDHSVVEEKLVAEAISYLLQHFLSARGHFFSNSVTG